MDYYVISNRRPETIVVPVKCNGMAVPMYIEVQTQNRDMFVVTDERIAIDYCNKNRNCTYRREHIETFDDWQDIECNIDTLIRSAQPTIDSISSTINQTSTQPLYVRNDRISLTIVDSQSPQPKIETREPTKATSRSLW